MAVACAEKPSFTAEELDLIENQGPVMKVFTVADESDSLVLRASCSDFNAADLKSSAYAALAEKMVATVTSPEQDGVGIAGPQVGLSRRIVAVQRFDKDDEPFEVYPNIRITKTTGDKVLGREGCLSVPGRRGQVLRYRDIGITYTSPRTLTDTTEHVEGFTAVIFQHECDHLDGVLYTDYL